MLLRKIARITKIISLTSIVSSFATHSFADTLAEKVLPLRERAEITNSIIKQRLDELVPLVMRQAGVDAWVIIAREYNEDPVLKTMLPATWLNARRRTVLLFIDHGDARGVERMAVARYAVGDLFPGVWNPEEQPDQYARIAKILGEFNPQKIALNYSDTYALADGLTFSEQRDFSNALSPQLRERIVSAEEVAVGWLETRLPEEIAVYKDVMDIAYGIIKEGFSSEVVSAGETSTTDLEWWFRQRVSDLGLGTWFHTSIEVERSDNSVANITANNQQNAYILNDGENDAPRSLKIALKAGNDLQDILTNNFEVGRTGNEILKMTRYESLARGIGPIIYTHPIGLHGHAAGTTIGMWDKQEGVPGTGDYPMKANTAYSIELTALVDSPEWSAKPMRMKLEEDGFFDGEAFEYIQPRQTEYHIIRSQ